MLNNQDCSEKLLVAQLKESNEKAFRKLYDTYRTILYKYSYSMVSKKTYAEEIVQDVFLSLWLKRETLDPELSIRSFLFTVTRNKTISFLKKASNNNKLREEIFYISQKSFDSIEYYMREKELEKIKQQALDLLPPKRRLIFEMSREHGKSYEEIAIELGLSINTVRNQISIALETLRVFLSKNHDLYIIYILVYNKWL